MAKMNLDLSAVSELSGKTVIPTGIYNVSISDAEVKEVGKGHMLKLTFSVLDGSEKGSSPREDMWVVHESDRASKFGKSKLKSILIAAGHKNPNFLADTDEMLGLKLKVSVEEAIQTKDGKPVCDDNGKPYRENLFKGFFKYDDEPSSSQEKSATTPERQITQSPATDAPAPQESTQAFPWQS